MVIVLMGILLALRFFFFNVQENPVQNARDVQLGANLLDTMLETTMVCKGVPLSVMLKDCATGASFQCDEIEVTKAGVATIVIPAGDSCAYANATIGYMLNSTLNTWGRKYVFEIEEKINDQKIEFKNPPGGCTAGFQKITRPRPIGGQTLTLVLKLCQ